MFRPSFSIALFALVFATLVCASKSANAEQTYCVSSVTELRNALLAAETDGDDSYIKIRTGTYEFFTRLRYWTELESLIPAGDLTVEGGYGPGCTSRVDDARLTTVRSGAAQDFLLATTTGSVMLKTFTVEQTLVKLESVADDCTPNGKRFELRRLRSLGGKIDINSDCHNIVLRDSVFASAADGYALQIGLASDGDVNHSTSLTMINSTVAEGRLYVYSHPEVSNAFLFNNVFRNASTEIDSLGVNVLALNNRYDSLVFSSGDHTPAGTLLPGSTGNISSAPNLDVDYRPNIGSAMINSGTSAVPGGLLSIDLYGGPRLVGSAVDRGALESAVDGSGVFTVTNASASGAGSLAQAVINANATAGYNIIKFNIPGNCPRRIVLAAGLSLQGSTLLDGWSQPGNIKNTEEVSWNAAPCIILDGNGSVGTAVLTAPQIGAGNLQVRGLAFEGFSTAILLSFGRNHLIFGNQFAGRVGTAGPVLGGNNIAITVAGQVFNTVIGGSDEPNRNLIGSSTTAGVQFIGASVTSNRVVNNLIGLDKNAAFALPNLDGVYISGSGNSVTGNRISRNSRDGVVLTSSNAHHNTVADNFLGGSIYSGPLTFPGNGRMGVLLDNSAHDNRIGPDNVIGSNGDSGVRVLSAAGGRNAIIGNRINLNGSPGIDLGADGVSSNNIDPLSCNATIGCAANRGQNFPRVTEALRVRSGFIPAGHPIRVNGSLTTTVSASPYRIEFFGSDSCYNEGNGEGSRYLGFVDVVVANAGICGPDNNCNKTFQTYLNELNVDIGDVITSTATSPDGNTSEFSECMMVTDEITDRIFADGFE